jgi:hypothetical protein
VPVSAIVHRGDSAYFWAHRDGHATRTEVQAGVSDGNWIEVTNRQQQPSSGGKDPWVPIDGTEQVILGDLSVLSEGAPVRLAGRPTTPEEKGAPPGKGPARAE